MRKRRVAAHKRSKRAMETIGPLGVVAVLVLLVILGLWFSESSTPPTATPANNRPPQMPPPQLTRREPVETSVKPPLSPRAVSPAKTVKRSKLEAPDDVDPEPSAPNTPELSEPNTSELSDSNTEPFEPGMELHAPEIVKKKKPSPPFEILSINKTAATAVSLPDMATGAIAAASLDMTVLGTVNFEPAQITLSLLGGEVASHELGTFHLQSSPTKTQPFRWLARYQNPAGQTAPIAEFVLSDRQLKFGWRAESKAHEEAHCLRNCLLKLAVGEKAQPIALRTPLSGKHLKLGLKNKTNEAYTIPWLPKGGRMKLELLLDDIELPSHEISRKVLNIESDRSTLTFSSSGQLLLEVKIRIEMDNTLLIAAVAQWTPPGGEPRIFDGAALAKLRDRLLKKLNVVVDSTQRDEIVAASEGIAELLNLAETIEAAGSLPFRVVMNVDGHEVVVLQSDQEASAETKQVPGPEE